MPAVCQAAGQGPNPRPRLKEEAHRGHTCHGQPALWVLNRSDAGVPCPLHPTAFVCSSSPSCSIQQPQDDLPSAAQAPKAPLRPAVKGRPSRAASYRPISRPPLLQARQQKKRGRPWAHWLPEAPRTQKGRRQRHFLGWQVLVSDSAQSTGDRRKAGVGFGQAGSADTQYRAPQG